MYHHPQKMFILYLTIITTLLFGWYTKQSFALHCSSAYTYSSKMSVLKPQPRRINSIISTSNHIQERNKCRNTVLLFDTTRNVIVSEPSLGNKPSPLTSIVNFFKSNWLVLGEVLVIFLAKRNPAFFASGGLFRPEITVSKLGVFAIFFINGVALSLGSASSPDDTHTVTKTNVLIQSFAFMFLPLMAKLLAPFYPVPAFRDGLLVLSCLPVTINICVAQTLAAGGNMATAIFNAIFANVVGVFLTPLLSVWLLGTDKGVSLVSTLVKLGNVVIFPLVLGQVVKRTALGPFFQRISSYSRTLSSFLL